MTNEKLLKEISLNGEVWKEPSGYERLYAVSSFGRIASLERYEKDKNGIIRVRHFKLMSPHLSSYGYYTLHFSRNGKYVAIRVNRIVAETFIPNPENKPCVDHINGDKQDNRVENLRWVSHLENNNNSVSLGRLRSKKEDARKPIVAIENDAIQMRFASIKEAVNMGFCKSSIFRCLNGTNSTHRGYKWMYLSDYENLLSTMSRNSKE